MLCPRCGTGIGDVPFVSLCNKCVEEERLERSRQEEEKAAGRGSTGAELGDFGPAGFWLRFWAYSVDWLICYYAILLPVYGIASLCGANVGFIALVTNNKTGEDVSYDDTMFLIKFIVPIVYSLIFLFYAVFESSSKQATPGKQIFALRVTRTSGDRLSFGRAMLRNISKLLSHAILFMGNVMAGLTSSKQALHDMISDCAVVRSRELPMYQIVYRVVITSVILPFLMWLLVPVIFKLLFSMYDPMHFSTTQSSSQNSFDFSALDVNKDLQGSSQANTDIQADLTKTLASEASDPSDPEIEDPETGISIRGKVLGDVVIVRKAEYSGGMLKLYEHRSDEYGYHMSLALATADDMLKGGSFKAHKLSRAFGPRLHITKRSITDGNSRTSIFMGGRDFEMSLETSPVSRGKLSGTIDITMFDATNSKFSGAFVASVRGQEISSVPKKDSTSKKRVNTPVASPSAKQ